VLRYLRKRGKLPAEGADDAPDDLDQDPPLLATLAAAAVQGRTALGPKAGAYAARLGRGSATGSEFGRGKLCADCEGFSLHAGICVPGYSRERLEKLQPDYDTTGPDRLPDPHHHPRGASLARRNRGGPPAVR
jgi:hypothetical protein